MYHFEQNYKTLFFCYIFTFYSCTVLLYNISCITNLKNLKLGFKGLSLIETEDFFNLNKLKQLFIHSNRFKALQDMKLKYLVSLEFIDLSDNLIEHIYENDFRFSSNLNSINLNNNLIKFIHEAAFVNLILLNTFKIGNNQLIKFNMSLLRNCKLLSVLDLSYNHVVGLEISHESFLENIKDRF